MRPARSRTARSSASPRRPSTWRPWSAAASAWSPRSRTSGRAWDIARRAGFDEALRSVRACDIPVLELEDPDSDARRVVTALCAEALAVDGSDSIVLGCAGMADFCRDISAQLGVPVIDGVSAGVKLVESLVSMGITTSRRDEFARPPAKTMDGLLAPFSLR
jgi:allantoin racemase